MATKKKRSEQELEAKLKKVNEERRKLNRELKELREKELSEKKDLAYSIICQILKKDSLIGIERQDIITQVNNILRARQGTVPAADGDNNTI